MNKLYPATMQDLEKGDKAGHPFHGNQHAKGRGATKGSMAQQHKALEQKHRASAAGYDKAASKPYTPRTKEADTHLRNSHLARLHREAADAHGIAAAHHAIGHKDSAHYTTQANQWSQSVKNFTSKA